MQSQSAWQETGQGKEVQISWQQQEGGSLRALGISPSGSLILYQQPQAQVLLERLAPQEDNRHTSGMRK